MASPILALFIRSLSQDSYRKETYQARAGATLFILVVIAIFAVFFRTGGAPGRTLFVTLIIVQTVYISLFGLSYFSTAVAEEKQEETLGLLRMTGLSPVSILLGNSTSRLCGALLLLTAQFPFTVLAVTFGGISLGQIFAAYCALAAYTFLFCNVALLGSVLARHTSGAAFYSAIFMGLLLCAGPLLGLISTAVLSSPPVSSLETLQRLLWESTVIARFNEVLTTGFAGSLVGWQVGSNLIMGAGFFLLAWAAFQRSCNRASTGEVTVGKGGALGVLLGRPPRPEKDALAWKDYHFLCGGRAGMILRWTLYGAGVAVTLAYEIVSPHLSDAARVLLNSVVPGVFSIDAGAIGADIFRVELRDRTLSTLAVLPCTMRDIARGKLRGGMRAAAPGAICTVLLSVIFVVSSVADRGTSEMIPAISSLYFYSNIPLLAILAALFSLDMKYGALPLSYFLTGWFALIVAGFAQSSAALCTGACGISFALAFYFHRQIQRQLEVVASRDY